VEQSEDRGLEQHQGRLVQVVESKVGLEMKLTTFLFSPAASASA
jgi:hypothetical protein